VNIRQIIAVALLVATGVARATTPPTAISATVNPEAAAAAAVPVAGAPMQAVGPQGMLDPAKVAAWGDQFFHTVMAQTHVPGAVFVVVDHGKIIVLRGYGVATPGGAPIDPNTTLFRLGSITKVLTAIAASQMIGEGRIRLDENVNHYLTQIQVPDTYGPISIYDLLSHEGGFGADLRGVDAPTEAGANISPAEMQRLLVPRVRPPGEFSAYDNNGWGVLGLALANASGMSYRQLIEQRVFRPLGMTHSVIGLPGTALEEAIGEHYVMPDGSVARISHSFLKPIEQGAGDASATGADMARLMIALLQGGEIDGNRILTPQEFHALTNMNTHRLHPMLPGLGRAIYEDRPNGHFALRHDGGMRGSADSMVLYPNRQIGVYFAVNARPYNPFDGETLSGLVAGVWQFLTAPNPKVSMAQFLPYLEIHKEFAQAFLGPPPPQKVDLQGVHELDDADLARLAGLYRGTPSQFASFVGNLQVEVVEGLHVAPGGHGTLLIGGERYRQVYPDLFESAHSDVQYAFRVTPFGTLMGTSALWLDRRAAWYSVPSLTVLPLILLPLLLVCAIFYVRSRRRLYRKLAFPVAALGALYALCLVLEAQYANYALVSNNMWMAVLWRLLLQAVLLGLLLWPVLLLRGWRREPPARTLGAMAAAVHLTLLALSGWVLILLAGYWQLIGRI
jgi:CubicO group peptidase (beta-lactamase class C family)